MKKAAYVLIRFSIAICVFEKAQGESTEYTIRAIPEAQAMLEMTVKFNASQNQNDLKELRSQSEKVEKLLGDRTSFRTEMVRQCTLYLELRENEARTDSMEQFWAIAPYFAAAKADMLAAVQPYLETNNEVRLRCLYFCLKCADEIPSSSDVDFSKYVAFLKAGVREHSAPSLGLMKYMYQRHPGRAVLDLTEIDEAFGKVRKLLAVANPKETPLFEQPPHRRSELRLQAEWDKQALSEELVGLSKSPKWWVRLWVVETLKQLPQLDGQPILDRLRTDPVEHIRDRILKPDPVPEEYRRHDQVQAPKLVTAK